MIYPSLQEFSQFYVKQVMSRFADFLPCSTASHNVITPIVVPYTESSQMEMNIMNSQISGTTSPPSHQPVRYVVRQRTVDHLQRNSPRATNRPHSANPTHSGDLPSTIHSQKRCHLSLLELVYQKMGRQNPRKFGRRKGFILLT